jgi:tRNA A37 threonylcarbamoyladenosine dehydratase
MIGVNMKKVVVIGVGGVGMVYVVATVRSNNKMVCIVDINQEILENSKKQWMNKWDTVVEGVDVDKECIYLSNIEELKGIDFNLCIIANQQLKGYSKE